MRADGGKRIRWIRLIGYLLAGAALYFAARHFQVSGQDLALGLERTGPQKFLLACGFFLLHLAANAVAFVFLCRTLGIEASSAGLVSAWMGSLLAKYVPGGVWQVVGRGLILARFGVSARISAVSGVIEQVISMLICIAIGATTMLLMEGSYRPVMVGAVALLGVGLSLMLWLKKRLRLVPLILSTAGYGLAMIPFLLGYTALLAPDDLLRFTSALFTGVVAGLLAVVVPGGLGVRESAVVLLDTEQHAGLLLSGLLVARLAILLSESILSIAGQLVLAAMGRRQ